MAQPTFVRLLYLLLRYIRLIILYFKDHRFGGLFYLPKFCWILIPGLHGSADILRACKEWFLVGATDIEYQSLPGPTWIRLLKIEAASSSTIIRCSLRQIDLDSKPNYTALSYTWNQDTTWLRAAYFLIKSAIKDYRQGKDVKIKPMQNTNELKRSHMVICNGRVTKIHPNMYNALVQLRRRSVGEYWIDAICINQRYHRVQGG
ncbi:hypothetical protein IG631_17163 [Alternaria alternata]|nr:hypothetical protein IG631_17163 [Alternaria alternata]